VNIVKVFQRVPKLRTTAPGQEMTGILHESTDGKYSGLTGHKVTVTISQF
jgi:hypothetical protein